MNLNLNNYSLAIFRQFYFNIGSMGEMQFDEDTIIVLSLLVVQASTSETSDLASLRMHSHRLTGVRMTAQATLTASPPLLQL